MAERRARPTTYKGIKMRSRLEAGYAAWLDARGWEWSYEPMAFGGGDGQYLPDFRVEGVTNHLSGHQSHAYVEVKPSYGGLDIDRLATRMAVVWESEPDAHLLIQAAPPHESQRIAAGRIAGSSAVRHVLDQSAYLFSLVRTEPPRWAVLTWLHCQDPTVGFPLPKELGPWPPGWWDPTNNDRGAA